MRFSGSNVTARSVELVPDPKVKTPTDPSDPSASDSDSAWAPFVEAFWTQAAPRLSDVAERAADHFGLLQKAKLWRAKNIIEDIGPAFARAFLEELGREAASMGPEHVAALQLTLTGRQPNESSQQQHQQSDVSKP
jgi:hypothetical protein